MKPIDDASLDDLLAQARAAHEVRFEPMTVHGRTLEFLQIADMVGHVERLAARAQPGEFQLPFWARIWPANLLLAHFLPKLGLVPGDRVLEIGAGIGVAGLFAASMGQKVLVTDVEPEALLFTRINILKNGLENNARAARADYTATRLDERFRCILGCEVVYREEQYRPLVKFLQRHLAPGGEAVLATDFRRKAHPFFQLADKEFHIQGTVIGCKASAGEGEEAERHLISIHRLTARTPPA